MKAWRIELAVLVACVAIGTLTARRWTDAASPSLFMRPLPALSRAGASTFGRATLSAAADTTVDNDPFRISNSPPSVQAKTNGTPLRIAPAPQPSRPILVLKAITGGPPWQAIVAGLPGQGGDAVVNSGAVFDALRIQSITRDSVVVRGGDTAWTLTMRRSSP
jgi:hypothetical protein